MAVVFKAGCGSLWQWSLRQAVDCYGNGLYSRLWIVMVFKAGRGSLWQWSLRQAVDRYGSGF